MLKNYIKIAWKVLLRRKYFTFISLFGISVTLLVLMITTAAADHFFNPGKPGSRLERTMFITRVEYKDSEDRTHIVSSPSYSFLNRHVKTLNHAEKVSLHSIKNAIVAYVNNKKLFLNLKYTDSQFWDIMEFDFLEGGAIDSAAVENADMVAVINEQTKREYFGDSPAVNKYIEADDRNFRVVGVLRNQDIPFELAHADIYVPITVSKGNLQEDHFYGQYNAFILAADKSQFQAIKNEFNGRVAAVIAEDSNIGILRFDLGTISDIVSQYILGEEQSVSKHLIMGGIVGLMILFMVLPTINLVNINLSRIIERASEIGVRKAFGASTLTLIGQFIVENVILTLIGGLIGFILSVIVLAVVTNSGILPYGDLSINLRVFTYCLLICLFFGLFSGVYPAYRMSRMHPVDALRGVDQ